MLRKCNCWMRYDIAITESKGPGYTTLAYRVEGGSCTTPACAACFEHIGAGFLDGENLMQAGDADLARSHRQHDEPVDGADAGPANASARAMHVAGTSGRAVVHRAVADPSYTCSSIS